MVRLTFLGTGTSQGVPMIACDCEVCRSEDSHDKRLRSSVMVESGGVRIVIDAGPDFRFQMLREHVHSIDAILLTHEHKDHTGGIDDVRAFNYFLDRPVDIYATERVQRAVHKDFNYAFGEKKYPGAPEISLHTITSEPFSVCGLEIVPVLGRHFMLPVTGFRIGSVAYLTDFNHIEDSELEKLRGLDCLVINALRREKHISHFTVDETIAVSRRIFPKRTFLTHASHQMGLYREVEKTLPEDIRLAYDGLTIESDY